MELPETLKNHATFAIYGAQVVAYGAYRAIRHLTGRMPLCFIVSRPEGNPAEIEGLPVAGLDTVPPDTLVIIAVSEILQDEIKVVLEQAGHEHIFTLSSHDEHLLMSAYYDSLGCFSPAAETGAGSELALYEVHHPLDRPLLAPPPRRPWVIPIQAGAALSDICICALRDDTGENISAQNGQYYEGSVMYWLWKNAVAPWVGVQHYRRHLLVTPDMLGEGVDAILPLPYMCPLSTLAQSARFISCEGMEAVLAALRKLHPAEYGGYIRCLEGKYIYAYNLVVARRDVYADFAGWLFGITQYLEAQAVGGMGGGRELSYIVEMLTSLYFMANVGGLRIRHVEKAIYR